MAEALLGKRGALQRCPAFQMSATIGGQSTTALSGLAGLPLNGLVARLGEALVE